MHIGVIGSEVNFVECQNKFGSNHLWNHVNVSHLSDAPFAFDLIFDFGPGNRSLALNYASSPKAIFLNAAFSSMVSKANHNYPIFGFTGLPTFVDRGILEVSLRSPDDRECLSKICKELDTSFQIVEDKAGLVTPRIICMIINEAWFALEDKTASKADIDIAMKLGTNYPFGPFDWCEKIGSKNVVRVLQSLGADGSERYKICELLLQEALTDVSTSF